MKKAILSIMFLVLVTSSCYATREYVVTKENDNQLRITETVSSATVMRISELRREIAELNKRKDDLNAQVAEIDTQITELLSKIQDAKRLGVIE
jgi:peptidoglycan hydrolase CwlO-like protein